MQKTCLLLFFLAFSLSTPFLQADWDKRVYLTSFPRAGNHWVRYLLEEATGIATSSAYCDQAAREYERMHLPTAFPWGFCPEGGFEGNRRYPTATDIVVLKTHFPLYPAAALDNKTYIRAICLIRHPIDCLYSQYIHSPPRGRIPSEVMEQFIADWKRFLDYWEGQKEVYVVRYEDLYNSPVSQLTKICTIAGLRVQDRDIKRAVNRYPPRGSVMKYITYFDKADLEEIERRLERYMKIYSYKM